MSLPIQDTHTSMGNYKKYCTDPVQINIFKFKNSLQIFESIPHIAKI